MLLGILPVKLLFLKSLGRKEVGEKLELKVNAYVKVNAYKNDETYKNHSPVNWHISGERVPPKLFSRSPLQMTHLPSNKQTKQLQISVTKRSCSAFILHIFLEFIQLR